MKSEPESDYAVREDRWRLAMRQTPEGHWLWHHCGMDWYDTESSARRVAEKAAEIIAALHSALTAASDHLDYCGYGRDSWERECAEAQGLEKQIADALKLFTPPE